jgi:hypothetical protein
LTIWQPIFFLEQAETKIKNFELITSEGLFIPSINQLRYAGYHIVRSLLNDDEKEYFHY